MRYVVAPDSFKGSLSARDAAAAIARGIRQAHSNADIIEFPLADGGEGTLDLIAAHEACECALMSVPGADGKLLDARYGLIDAPQGTTAVIETAAVVGASQRWAQGVLARSTVGIGTLIRALQARGIERFIVALGGSATNDAGAGMLSALGAKFLDAGGQILEPGPAALQALDRVDLSQLRRPHSLLGLADVDNELLGPSGATHMFGPQKGLALADVPAVDATLARYARLCDNALNVAAHSLPGSGAAGGLGYAVALLGGELISGADWLLERYHFDALVSGADWLITGEGKSDAQTLRGKGPWRVASLAKRSGVRTLLLCGALDMAAWPGLNAQFDEVHAIGIEGEADSMREAAKRLENAAMRWAQDAGKTLSR